MKRLRDALALRLDIVQAPKYQSHRAWITALLFEMATQQSVGREFCSGESQVRRNRIRIDRMSIASGGQDLRILHDVGAWSGLDVLAAQRAQQRVNLVIGIKLFGNVRQQQKNRKGFLNLNIRPGTQPLGGRVSSSMAKLAHRFPDD